MPPPPADRPQVPLKTEAAIYSAGLFSNSMADVVSVILPLWLASMGASTAAIGMVVGAKHVLPLLLAIHGGAVIDRLGARQVTLVCAVLSALCLILFPAQSWIGPIVFLQMMNGFASSMCWMGAQASFGRVLLGHPEYAGRFSFALRTGSLVGPPLGGLAYDLAGPWGGFGFLALWAIGILASGLALPASEQTVATRSIVLADLMPRASDYRAAFHLALEPAMSIVLLVSLFRIAASSIQDSFYPIYLGSIGFSATQIGLLITVASAVAAASTLWVGTLARHVQPIWLLVIATFGSIIFIATTPLFTSFWALMVMAALRGVSMGVSQPLMLSLLSTTVDRSKQGLGVALRTTCNRAAAAATPMTMGLTATVVGLNASFLVMGAVLMGCTTWIALKVRKEWKGGT